MPMKLPQQSSGNGSAVLPRKLTANILEMDGLKWTIFLDRFSHLYENGAQLKIRAILHFINPDSASTSESINKYKSQECIKDPGHVLDQLRLDRGYGEGRVIEQFVLKMLWVICEDRVSAGDDGAINFLDRISTFILEEMGNFPCISCFYKDFLKREGKS
ncbi:hypothetical protein SADUNF_Sadunf07G0120300 [Salix dunnii]|uniref:Uncharacterized protein n=1 Tax=Salix dunnii TaxID=1413687 RepID=A0A835K0J9_9ROSI|nr:hypothetical protein SADUNF_Sadunf07G0120300 [Salix dunnii]